MLTTRGSHPRSGTLTRGNPYCPLNHVCGTAAEGVGLEPTGELSPAYLFSRQAAFRFAFPPSPIPLANRSEVRRRGHSYVP